MASLLQNSRTVLSNPQMLTSYIMWCSKKALAADPKIRTFFGGHVGHMRHFSEFWSRLNHLPPAREEKLIEQVLSPNAHVFDIGANVGVFTIMMSKCCSTAKIHAFEPNTSTASILKQNIQDNRIENVVIQNAAVCDYDGTISFTDIAKSPSQNKIITSELNESEIVKTRCVSIDSYCAENKIDFVHFIKIDVEGAELLVLKGAENLLRQKKIDSLFLEIIPHAVVDMGLNLQDLLDYVNDIGYCFHKVDEDGRVGAIISLEEMKTFTLENVLLVPNKH